LTFSSDNIGCHLNDFIPPDVPISVIEGLEVAQSSWQKAIGVLFFNLLFKTFSMVMLREGK